MRRWREAPLSPSWLRYVAIACLGLIPTLFVWAIIIAEYPRSNGGDGPFFFRLIEVGKVSISRWHELPLWNPYECGGVPLWDNPQTLHSAPLILALQPFNTSFTIAVWIFVHVVIGFVGMWLLCRDELGTSRTAAFVAASVYSFNASSSNHIAGGHTGVAAFHFAPLVLFLWRRAEHSRRAAIGVGLLAANLFYESGIYGPALIALMILIETFTRLTSKERVLLIGKAAAVAFFVALTFGAARVIPVIDQGLHHKRFLYPEGDALDWQLLKDMYLARSHALRFGHDYVWGEYISYTGPIILALAIGGLLLSATEKRWFFIVAGGLFLLMLGHFATYAPWSVLKHHVPPFQQMRVPSRFRLLLIIFIAGWAAMAVDRLPRFFERFGARGSVGRALQVAVIGLAFLGAGDGASHSIDVIGSQWNAPAPVHVVPSTRLYLGGANLAQFIDQPRQNRGRLECWEEWVPYAPAALWAGDLPQARALGGEKATVYSVDRTQNKFFVDVEVREPVTLLFNTSFGRGWRSDLGTVREEKGQLAVDLPPGHHKLKVWYWPVGFTLGIVITLVGLAGTIALWLKGSPRRP